MMNRMLVSSFKVVSRPGSIPGSGAGTKALPPAGRAARRAPGHAHRGSVSRCFGVALLGTFVRVRSPDGARPSCVQSAASSSRTASSRAGSNGARSTLDDTPSQSSSAIARPLAGAFSIPQQLWPVAT